jgi:hypothetical protein
MDEAIALLIQMGEKQMQEEEQAEAEKKRKVDEEFRAIREGAYEQVRQLIPEAVRPYLDTSDDEYSAFVDNDEHWEDGRITYSYKAAEVQTLRLRIPGCAPIHFIAELGEGGFIRYYSVMQAKQSYSDEPEAYYSPNGYGEDRIEDVKIAVALAAREYKKFQDIEARCERVKQKMAAKAMQEAEIASQARNDSTRVDYLGEANKMMDQFHNTGYPNDLNCAMTYSMMGILDYLKKGAALTAILMDQDELDQSVKIWGSDGS